MKYPGKNDKSPQVLRETNIFVWYLGQLENSSDDITSTQNFFRARNFVLLIA